MNNTIRIGFCSDLSGPYEEVDGMAGAWAIQYAIQDQQSVGGRPVELLLGDHHNDPSEAERIANEWCTSGAVDLIISGVNSDTSLAITAVAAELRKPVFVVGADTSVQTLERPSELVVQYAYSTLSLATTAGKLLTESGKAGWSSLRRIIHLGVN